MCLVPSSNIAISFLNIVFLYLFFARHSIAMEHDAALFKFTEQEVYKHYIYMLFNIMTIGLELPYTFGSCFGFEDRDSPIDNIVKYSELLHQLNQGILKLFLEYSMFE